MKNSVIIPTTFSQVEKASNKTSKCYVQIDYLVENEKLVFKVSKSVESNTVEKINSNFIIKKLNEKSKQSKKFKLSQSTASIDCPCRKLFRKEIKAKGVKWYIPNYHIMEANTMKDTFPVSQFKFQIPVAKPKNAMNYCCINYDGTKWEKKQKRHRSSKKYLNCSSGSTCLSIQSQPIDDLKQKKDKMQITMTPKCNEDDNISKIHSKIVKKHRKIIVTSSTLNVENIKQPKRNQGIQTDLSMVKKRVKLTQSKKIKLKRGDVEELMKIKDKHELKKILQSLIKQNQNKISNQKVYNCYKISNPLQGNKLSKVTFPLTSIVSDDCSSKRESVNEFKLKPKIPQRHLADNELLQLFEDSKNQQSTSHFGQINLPETKPQMPRKQTIRIEKDTVTLPNENHEDNVNSPRPSIPHKRLENILEEDSKLVFQSNDGLKEKKSIIFVHNLHDNIQNWMKDNETFQTIGNRVEEKEAFQVFVPLPTSKSRIFEKIKVERDILNEKIIQGFTDSRIKDNAVIQNELINLSKLIVQINKNNEGKEIKNVAVNTDESDIHKTKASNGKNAKTLKPESTQSTKNTLQNENSEIFKPLKSETVQLNEKTLQKTKCINENMENPIPCKLEKAHSNKKKLKKNINENKTKSKRFNSKTLKTIKPLQNTKYTNDNMEKSVKSDYKVFIKKESNKNCGNSINIVKGTVSEVNNKKDQSKQNEEYTPNENTPNTIDDVKDSGDHIRQIRARQLQCKTFIRSIDARLGRTIGTGDENLDVKQKETDGGGLEPVTFIVETATIDNSIVTAKPKKVFVSTLSKNPPAQLTTIFEHKENIIEDTNTNKVKMFRSNTCPVMKGYIKSENMTNKKKDSKLPVLKRYENSSLKDDEMSDISVTTKNLSLSISKSTWNPGSINNSTFLFTKVDKDQNKESCFKKRKDYYQKIKKQSNNINRHKEQNNLVSNPYFENKWHFPNKDYSVNFCFSKYTKLTQPVNEQINPSQHYTDWCAYNIKNNKCTSDVSIESGIASVNTFITNSDSLNIQKETQNVEEVEDIFNSSVNLFEGTKPSDSMLTYSNSGYSFKSSNCWNETKSNVAFRSVENSEWSTTSASASQESDITITGDKKKTSKKQAKKNQKVANRNCQIWHNIAHFLLKGIIRKKRSKKKNFVCSND